MSSRTLHIVGKILGGSAVLLALAAGLGYRGETPAAELEARYADAASRFVELAGVRVHYKDEGAGPALLLLHGTGSSLHAWDGWVDDLGSGHRILRPDLTAFGLTGPDPRGDYSHERRAEVLVALLDHAGVETCTVGGNSLGGAVALQLAIDAPERVERLVLVDSAGYPLSRMEGALNVLDVARIGWLGRILSRLTPRWVVARAITDAWGDPSKVSAAMVDRHYELLLREGNRQALLAGLATESSLPPESIRSIRQPTLLLWGREDRLIAVETADRFLADLPDAELIVYDGVGHVPMEEIPERSARDVARFLRGSRTSSPTTGTGPTPGGTRSGSSARHG